MISRLLWIGLALLAVGFFVGFTVDRAHHRVSWHAPFTPRTPVPAATDDYFSNLDELYAEAALSGHAWCDLSPYLRRYLETYARHRQPHAVCPAPGEIVL